jgi:hypothetical protein
MISTSDYLTIYKCGNSIAPGEEPCGYRADAAWSARVELTATQLTRQKPEWVTRTCCGLVSQISTMRAAVPAAMLLLPWDVTSTQLLIRPRQCGRRPPATGGPTSDGTHTHRFPRPRS